MVLQDHLNVIKKGEYMNNLNNEEMKNITGGGISVTGAFLSSIKGCISVMFEIGQAVGGAVRRITSGSLCNF